MHTFTDSAGRTWQVAVTVGAIKRVKGLMGGVDLSDLLGGSPPLLSRLGSDVVLLADVLYALCRPQADALAVTDEQFGAALGGDVIVAAQDVLMEELSDFFRSLRRTEVAKAIQKQQAVIRAAVTAAEARIEAVNVEGLVAAAFPPGNSAGNLPESSVLTPAP
jgi:hypothetical protein